MSNIKKREFYDSITGECVSGENYGFDCSVFKKVDNVDMVFDSRGQYLGIRTCRGKIINGKYTSKQGIRDFKSADDLRIWAGKQCADIQPIETKDGQFLQLGKSV